MHIVLAIDVSEIDLDKYYSRVECDTVGGTIMEICTYFNLQQ